MRSITEFFARFGTLMLFIFLEIVCLSMIVNLNDKQKSIYEHTSLVINGEIQSRLSKLTSYIGLREKVKQLQKENAQLRAQKVQRIDIVWNEQDSVWEEDSSRVFNYYPAEIISNNIELRNNSLSINKGNLQGIKEGWGVISDEGVVGVIRFCSENYCSILPLINLKSSISASIRSSDYFGNLEWSGPDIRKANLNAVPKHATFNLGDTIVTSGYSTIFPRNLPIGTITDFSLPSGSNFYEIEVKLFVDFGNLEHIYVVQHKDQEAIQQTYKQEELYE